MGIAQQMEALDEQLEKLRSAADPYVTSDTSTMSIGEIADGLGESPEGKSWDALTWDDLTKLSALVKKGAVSLDTVKAYIGKEKVITASGYEPVTCRLVGINHHDRADGSGKALFTFECYKGMSETTMFGGLSYGFDTSQVQEHIDDYCLAVQKNLYRNLVDVKWTLSQGVSYAAKMSCLAAIEFGTASGSTSTVGSAVEFYAKDGSRAKYNASGSQIACWIRESAKTQSQAIVLGTGGGAEDVSKTNSYHVGYAFCIG